MAHEDDDEAFDASDDGHPHVGDMDEAILYAAQLEQLRAAGFHADHDGHTIDVGQVDVVPDLED